MRKITTVFLMTVLIFYSHARVGTAEEASHVESPEKSIKAKEKKEELFKYVQFEVREWYSFGESEWRISFEDPSWGKIESILEFKDIDAPITLTTLRVKPGLYWLTLEGSIGFGNIDSGTTVDTDLAEDWIFAYSGSDVWSESESDTDGDIFIMDVKMSLRIYPWDEKALYYVDGLLGYLYYEEKLHMTDGVQTIPDTGSFNGLNSTYEFNWDAFLMGLKMNWALIKEPHPGLYNLSIAISTMAGPIRYRGYGVWNLRSDFAQDPSFKHEASEGLAAFLDIGLIYQPISHLSLKAGYQLFSFEAHNGTDTVFFSDGTEAETDLDKVTSIRHGPYLSISGQF